MSVLSWLSAHHTQLVGAGFEGLAVLNGIVQAALVLKPLPSWLAMAETRPRIAALVRFMLAIGMNPLATLQSAVDFLRAEVSKGGAASTKALAVSVSRPIISPPKDKP